MISNWPLLSLLIWIPILGGSVVLATANLHWSSRSRLLALLTSLVTLGLCVPLYRHFDATTSAMQYVELIPWITPFNINYSLGIDGIALPLIILNCFATLIVVIAAWQSVQSRVAQYLAAFLILAGLINGVFAALDAILFYVFWEAMLVPMFLIIGIWGGQNRIYATIKFFLYTFLGSVFMLVALIYLYLQSGSFSVLDFHQLPIPLNIQILVFIAFLLAFAVKVPMWPVHTWLPDAHTEAPTGGSIILAAVLLKVGAYGFLRFSLPIVPDASQYLSTFMIVLSLIAIVYIGFVAIMQLDLKKLIAYSSVAHMGFVTLGIFVVFALLKPNDVSDGALLGMQGAMVQVISHGFVSGALFLGVGILYDRLHSRKISDYGGVVNSMPVFSSFFMIYILANAGMPGTSAFVGEFMVILSALQVNFWYAVLAGTTLVLGAVYMLWMAKRVIFGPIANERIRMLQDVNAREIFLLFILAIPILLFGLWPHPLLVVMEATLHDLLMHISVGKL